MKLCIFTPTFLPLLGGAEVALDNLARQFVAKGHSPVVLAHGQPADLDVPYPVHRYQKPFCHRWFPERIGRHLRTLHQNEHFDLVMTIYGHPTGYAAVRERQRTGVPVVIGSQGGDLYRSSMRRRHRHLWKRIELAYRNADGLVAISTYMESLIRQINPDPKMIELIPNGLDPNELSQPAKRPADYQDTRPFCLSLGNLGPMKGFDDAIEAFARVRDQISPTILLVVGKGKLENELQQKARDLNVLDDVLFLGQRTGNDKRWLLQNCRFGVIPSLEEGHPLVGLEFLSVGRPVICSTNAAFDCMYDHEVNCLRVDAQRPTQLAEALRHMNGLDLARMGQISRERANTFEWSRIADRYLAFFDRVIEQASARRPI